MGENALKILQNKFAYLKVLKRRIVNFLVREKIEKALNEAHKCQNNLKSICKHFFKKSSSLHPFKNTYNLITSQAIIIAYQKSNLKRIFLVTSLPVPFPI
jgi:hypothetical protein